MGELRLGKKIKFGFEYVKFGVTIGQKKMGI